MVFFYALIASIKTDRKFVSNASFRYTSRFRLKVKYGSSCAATQIKSISVLKKNTTFPCQCQGAATNSFFHNRCEISALFHKQKRRHCEIFHIWEQLWKDSHCYICFIFTFIFIVNWSRYFTTVSVIIVKS